MAKTSVKRASKSNSANLNDQVKKTSSPPSPYSIPPPSLQPFLGDLNPAHIYIVHIDNHPWTFKRRIFTVPVIMNVVIALLLLWRAKVAVPSYVALILAVLGYESTASVDVAHTETAALIWILARRAGMFFVDWALARVFVPWPLDFFLGSPASPFLWRWTVGFQDQEIIVRISRKWDRDLSKDWLSEESDGVVYQERIMPAIDRIWVQAKTGYLMLDKSWNLDYAGMIMAHTLVLSGKMNISDFQKTVIVYSESHGWLVWQVYKLDEGNQEDGRKKLILFKDKLTAMGKENLFYRWIEILQYETSQPGGFTQERQMDTMRKVKQLFESQGVDFDQFLKDIGGLEDMPGMGVTQ